MSVTGTPADPGPTRAVATGVGSMPGEAFTEATKVVLGSLPDLPHLPELPDRGRTADMVGRALAVVDGLGFDAQPAGWRLTDAPGVDHRRARSMLAQDLDVLEELTQGREWALGSALKLQLTGPWTLASLVEKPRGDKVLSDHGARRDLAQALAEGVRTHLADVRRRVPGADLLLQVDEPALPSVLDGAVPTASGFGRHRKVHPPEASQALEWLVEAAASVGDVPVVAHCCHAEVPVALLHGTGAQGVSVDLDVLPARALDEVATVLDEGGRLFLGVVPSAGPQVPATRSVLERVRRFLDMLGFDPEEVAGRLVLTPGCGLAGASPAYARGTLGTLAEAAAELV